MEVNSNCFPTVKEEMDTSDVPLHDYPIYPEKDRNPYENKTFNPFDNKIYENKLHETPYVNKPHIPYEIDTLRYYESKRLEMSNKAASANAFRPLNGKEQGASGHDFVQELAILSELSQQLHHKDKLNSHKPNSEILHRGTPQSSAGDILNLRSERVNESVDCISENMESHNNPQSVEAEQIKPDNRNYRRKFECSDCHKNFPSKIKLQVHLKSHSEEEKLQCDVCQMRFAHKTGYTRHIRAHNNRNNSCSDEGLLINRNAFPGNYNPPYNTFNPVYGGCYNPPFGPESGPQNNENWSQCDVCKAVFMSKLEFNKHKRTHFQPKERHYKCGECQKSFVSRSSLSTHEKNHRSERNFKCKDCGISFHRRYFLRQHSKIHSGKKIYTCHECCHNFTTKLALNVHMRIHTGEKPYECNYCGKCFTCKFYLDTHVRTHTGEKPFKCEICEKCFSQKSTLNTHKRLHARYNNTDPDIQ